MRFLAAEYRPIQNAITQSGRTLDEFSFVKKRGKLHVFHPGAKEPFVFFRKTTTQLNDQKQWEKRVTYLLYGGGVSIPLDRWEAVLEVFQTWLDQLSPS